MHAPVASFSPPSLQQQLLQGVKTWLFFLGWRWGSPVCCIQWFQSWKKEKSVLCQGRRAGAHWQPAAAWNQGWRTRRCWCWSVSAFTYMYTATMPAFWGQMLLFYVFDFNHLCKTNVLICFQKKYQKWLKLTKSLVSKRNTAPPVRSLHLSERSVSLLMLLRS